MPRNTSRRSKVSKDSKGSSRPHEPEAIRNLMVNYIPTTIDEMQLRQLFEMYGPIESIKIVCDRETRQSKGYGFVKYRFSFSAMHAIQYLNGYPLMNKRLKVAYANATEAAKCSQSIVPDLANPYSHYHPPEGAQGEAGANSNPAFTAYMQQVAALQMMQYQQMMLMQQQQAAAAAAAANTNGKGTPQ